MTTSDDHPSQPSPIIDHLGWFIDLNLAVLAILVAAILSGLLG